MVDGFRALSNCERILVVAAHPDDIEWGMVGTVARLTEAGKSVSYLLATRGEAGSENGALSIEQVGQLREEEERAAAARVGVEHVEFLGIKDSQVYYGPELRKAIARVIRQRQPQAVMTSTFESITWWGNNHPDHRHVGQATVDAILDASLRASFPELLEEGLQAWRGCKFLLISSASDCNCWVDTTPVVDKAVASLAEHKSYLDELGLDADQIVRGRTSEIAKDHGVEHAEVFRIFSL